MVCISVKSVITLEPELELPPGIEADNELVLELVLCSVGATCCLGNILLSTLDVC